MDYEASQNETFQDTNVSLLLHIKIKDINSENLNILIYTLMIIFNCDISFSNVISVFQMHIKFFDI